jgi:hypothetical protein
VGGHALIIAATPSADVGLYGSGDLGLVGQPCRSRGGSLNLSILWWLAPPVIATGLAMLWAAWAGRPRRALRPDESADAYEKFTGALRRPLPERARGVVRQPPERLAGVALRPTPSPKRPQWGAGGPPRPNTRRTGT